MGKILCDFSKWITKSTNYDFDPEDRLETEQIQVLSCMLCKVSDFKKCLSRQQTTVNCCFFREIVYYSVRSTSRTSIILESPKKPFTIKVK